MAPGKYACSQVCERWGAEEERHYRPGHHWVFELGMGADGTCIEKSFSLPRRSFEVYKGVRFYDGEHAVVVKRSRSPMSGPSRARDRCELGPR